MSTCNRLDLGTVGSQLVIMSKNFSGHCSSVFTCYQYRAPQRDQCSRLKTSLPFKRHLTLQNLRLLKQPFKMQPQFEMNTSLEVLNLIYMSQEPTSVRHCHYKKWS